MMLAICRSIHLNVDLCSLIQFGRIAYRNSITRSMLCPFVRIDASALTSVLMGRARECGKRAEDKELIEDQIDMTGQTMRVTRISSRPPMPEIPRPCDVERKGNSKHWKSLDIILKNKHNSGPHPALCETWPRTQNQRLLVDGENDWPAHPRA